jgi:aldehyde dehydrogenase (NAD+)
MQRMFIAGQWVAAQDGRSLAVHDPCDGSEFERIPRGGAAEVDAAVVAARAALAGPWGRFTATERGRVLMKISHGIVDHAEELAQIEARDTGKPLTTARNDIAVLARYFEFYAGAADKLHGETIPFAAGHQVLLLREPLGVTAHIVPWNYPAQMFGRTLAPALAAGNATVLKPAEDTPLSALRVAAIAQAAGLPDGVLNIVTGLGEEAGAALAGHPGIDFVSFTGSREAGAAVQTAAARNAVKCVLELGGKSPQIVFADADFDRALPIVLRAIVQNAGQTCTAGSRLLVQQPVYEAFLARVGEGFARLKAGTPAMDLDCGPLMNAAQQRRVQGHIARARASGVAVLAEGQIAEGVAASGHWVRPTLFGPVPRDHALAHEEVFGPVLAAMPFDDEADAIALANGTEYGLLAAVWTENGGRQLRLAKALKVGQVFVNGYGAGGGVELPFGGTKRSGHGREKGLLALHEMSNPKTVVLYHG